MLHFKIALRFLKSSLSQTILIVFGIAVGVSVQIFIGSLISGLQSDLINTTIGNSSQITIKDENYLDNYQDIETYLDENKDIKKVTPVLSGAGSAVNDLKSEPVVFLGLENSENNIYDVKNKLVSGNMPMNNSQVVLGEELFNLLDLNLNDDVLLTVPLVGENTFKVVGTFDLGISSLNKTYMVFNLETVQGFLNEENKVSRLEMQVNDVFSASSNAKEIKEHYNSSYIVTNWEDENADLLSGLTAQSSSSLLIQVFVSISVVLAIASVLAISVEKKQRQIGILKAMGMTDKGTSKIFLFEGLILGFFGALFGVGLGLLLNFSFTTLP